jgi:hypothetical protein
MAALVALKRKAVPSYLGLVFALRLLIAEIISAYERII